MLEYWLGVPTTTTATVCGRAGTTGTVTLTCSAGIFTASADTAVADGTFKVEVTGLTPDARVAYTMTIPGESETASGILRTFPEAGTRAVKIGIFGCTATTYSHVWPLLQEDLDLVICNGDEMYPENNSFSQAEISMTATDSLAAATDITNFTKCLRLSRLSYEKRTLIRQTPYFYIPDDHDFGVNDLDWDLSRFQSAISGITTLDQCRSVMDTSAQAIWWYSRGNPANPDAGTDTNPFYTRFTVGDVEVFVISCCCWGYDTSSSTRLVRPLRSTLDAGCLGALQLQWLKDRLKASTAPIKLIVSPKMTDEAQFSNVDGWNTPAAWNEFLSLGAYIHAATDWAVPGGVIWACGDFHSPSVHARYNGVDGSTFDHAAVTVCPCGQDSAAIRNAGNAGTFTVQHVDNKSGSGGPSSAPEFPDLRCVGVFEADATKVSAQIIKTTGGAWWKGQVLAGSNALSYPALRIAI